MRNGLSKFEAVGNLGGAVEMQTTSTGAIVARYTVACNVFSHDRNDNLVQACHWIPVTTYGKQAQNDIAYLGKGSEVIVHGRIESWYDKDAGKGGFNFVGEDVIYLGRPRYLTEPNPDVSGTP